MRHAGPRCSEAHRLRRQQGRDQPAGSGQLRMVVGLHAWVEKTLQPAAQEALGSPVTRLRNLSGYACRNRIGSQFHGDRLSEHALANAVDIAGFVTADGRSIEVARHWGPTARDQREAEKVAAARAKDAASPADKGGHPRASAPSIERSAPSRTRQSSPPRARRRPRPSRRRSCKSPARARRTSARIPGPYPRRLLRPRGGCQERGGPVPPPAAQGRVRRVRHGARPGGQRGPPRSFPFRTWPTAATAPTASSGLPTTQNAAPAAVLRQDQDQARHNGRVPANHVRLRCVAAKAE
jgi:hypothetical protein